MLTIYQMGERNNKEIYWGRQKHNQIFQGELNYQNYSSSPLYGSIV